MTQVVIIPHEKIKGGAGMYIQDLIDQLRRKNVSLVCAGMRSSSYRCETIHNSIYKYIGSIFFPSYCGINVARSVFAIAKSLYKLPLILFHYTFLEKKANTKPKLIIFTSSCQALAVPILKWLMPSVKCSLIVQEDINFRSLQGALTLALIRNADLVITITDHACRFFRKKKIKSICLPNTYSESFGDFSGIEYESDLLYVGGGSKIKGFDNFLAIASCLLKKPNLTIICVGIYSKKHLIRLRGMAKDANPSSRLIIRGFVNNMKPFFKGTKVLVLPLSSPHFCRPAIECGFYSKPFVISRFTSLNEFALHGYNCVKPLTNSPANFCKCINTLLNNQQLREHLGSNNNSISIQYLASNVKWSIGFSSLLELCCPQ